MIAHIWPILAAIAATAAAILWWISATISEPAPPETAGVGALLGGYLISLDRNGKRIDLHKTLEKQSYWSARAAIAAGASALLGAIAVWFP
jgi:hypothetical protein